MAATTTAGKKKTTTKKVARKKAGTPSLESRVAQLESKVQTLTELLDACCGDSGGDPSPGHPCRSGRAVIVSGYEVTSEKHGADLLKIIFDKKGKGGSSGRTRKKRG